MKTFPLPNWKLLVSVLSLVFVLHNSGYSQLGIRIGANFSNLEIEEGIDLDQRTGVQAGLNYTIGISEYISLRPGVLFSMKGYERLEEVGDLSYLEVPISLLFDVIAGVYLEFGPYAGVLLESNQIFDVDYENLDLGLNVGAGIRLGRLSAGLTYGYGIANIVEGDFISGGENVRNKNIAVYGIISF